MNRKSMRKIIQKEAARIHRDYGAKVGTALIEYALDDPYARGPKLKASGRRIK